MARDISHLESDLKKFIASTITREMELEFAELVAQTIYKRTKSGKGLTINKVSWGDNSLKEIKPLSPEYVSYRSRKILGPFASPRRSNLTFTGELLESIIARIKGDSAIVEIQDIQHSSGVKMKELAEHVSENGRPFFGLADSEVKIVENYIRRKIRERIRFLNK